MKRYRVTMSFNILAENDKEANELSNHILKQMDEDEDNKPMIEDIRTNVFGSIGISRSVLKNKEND